MIRVEDIRKRAASVLPETGFQRYGDSPTIRSYTDWSAFEDAMRLSVSSGFVSGVVRRDTLTSFSFDPSQNRMLAYHFANLPAAFIANDDTVVLRSEADVFALQHVLFCVNGEENITIHDFASDGPKSTTLDVLVHPGASLRLKILVSGAFPQYLHARYHLGSGSTLSIQSVVLSGNARVHHEFFLNGSSSSLRYTGASIRGRSDVITDAFVRGSNNTARLSHALFSAEGDFLVHRGVIRVERTSTGTDADMDSAFYTTGGLAVSVPTLEVLTDDVRRASHRSRDLSLGEEQMLYLRARGLSESEILDLYVSSLLEHYAGNLKDEKTVRSAIRAFSESIRR